MPAGIGYRIRMIPTRTLWISAGLLVAAGAGAALGATFAQEPQEPDEAAAMVKPGPEHEPLMKNVGTWSAAIKVYMAPGEPPMEWTGTEVNRLECSGLWVTSSLDSPDGSFSGRGISGWDAQKKKYVSVWVDSWSTYLGMSTGTFDKSKNVFSFIGEQLDPATGKMIKNREVTEYPDANTRKLTIWSTPADGKEVKGIEVVYTRSK